MMGIIDDIWQFLVAAPHIDAFNGGEACGLDRLGRVQNSLQLHAFLCIRIAVPDNDAVRIHFTIIVSRVLGISWIFQERRGAGMATLWLHPCVGPRTGQITNGQNQCAYDAAAKKISITPVLHRTCAYDNELDWTTSSPRPSSLLRCSPQFSHLLEVQLQHSDTATITSARWYDWKHQQCPKDRVQES